MGLLDPAKLLVVLVVALIVLGPEKLPSTARQLGSAWRTVTHYQELVGKELKETVDSLDLPKISTVRPSQTVHDLLAELVAAPQSSLDEVNLPSTANADLSSFDNAEMN